MTTPATAPAVRRPAGGMELPLSYLKDILNVAALITSPAKDDQAVDAINAFSTWMRAAKSDLDLRRRYSAFRKLGCQVLARRDVQARYLDRYADFLTAVRVAYNTGLAA